MNRIYGLGLIGLGFALGLFIGRNHRLVRKTGRRLEALREDARGLMDAAGEWIGKGAHEVERGREALENVAESAASAYGKLTA